MNNILFFYGICKQDGYTELGGSEKKEILGKKKEIKKGKNVVARWKPKTSTRIIVKSGSLKEHKLSADRKEGQ